MATARQARRPERPPDDSSLAHRLRAACSQDRPCSRSSEARSVRTVHRRRFVQLVSRQLHTYQTILPFTASKLNASIQRTSTSCPSCSRSLGLATSASDPLIPLNPSTFSPIPLPLT